MFGELLIARWTVINIDKSENLFLQFQVCQILNHILALLKNKISNLKYMQHN